MKKIKITLSILLSVITFLCSHGQTGGGIFEGDVTLTSQAEVDAFPYTEVTGILTISGSSIDNLDGLSELTRVRGLTISGNANLTNVDGLSALSQAGSFINISDNPVLANLNGLSSVTEASGCSITIHNNALLGTIGGGFSSISGNLVALRISANPQLRSVEGFRGVTSIGSYDGGELIIDNNPLLTDIRGLASLTSFGGKSNFAQITNNDALLNLDGLSSLHHIGGTVAQLTISGNDALKNLNGLVSLTYIGTDEMGSLLIQNNSALENIDGLLNLRHGLTHSSSKIIVTNNSSLSRCSGLLPLLLSLGREVVAELESLGNIDVSENGAGCTLDDILTIPQVCQGDFVLSSQAEVDAFFCAEVIGSLTISGTDITDLKNLSVLTKVSENLNIVDNPNLENLDGFNNLTTVGPIAISNNPNLVRISGFHSLLAIRPSLSYPISILIHQNDALTNLDCFSALASVGTIRISMNNQLTALDGFSSVTKLYGELEINSNALLKSINAFQGLIGMSSISREVTDVGIVITNNPSLESFTGLSSLKEIYSQYICRINISNNPSLKDLDGLSSLTTVVENRVSIQIVNNVALENIDGLSALVEVVAYRFEALNITITQNPLLAQCCGLRPLLENLDERYGLAVLVANGNLLISDNGGCSVEDIVSCGPQSIIGLHVINEQTGERRTLHDSVTIDLANSYYSNGAIEASTFPLSVGSVVFKINQQVEFVDNESPYTLSLKELGLGNHEIICEPYSEPDLQGEKGIGKSTFVTIMDSSPEVCTTDDLAGDPDATIVRLHWTPYSGSETVEYHVKRNGERIGSTVGKHGYFTDVGLSPDSTYSYSVEVVGSNGQVICRYSPITVKTTSQTTIKTRYKLLAIVFNPTGELNSELNHIRTFLNYRIDFLKYASQNSVNLDLYKDDIVTINAFPPLVTSSAGINYAQLALTNYPELDNNTIVDLIERYDIDIVWVLGSPTGYDFAENVLLGNRDLGNQTWVSTKVKCSRSFFLHSNSGDSRAFDAAAHHVEGTMTSVTEGSPENWPRDKEFLVYRGDRSDFSVYSTKLHLWGRFRLTDEWNGRYGVEGHLSNAYASKGNASCGSSHFVPGSIRSSSETSYDDYTYYDIKAWQRYVDCFADEWLNYPNFSNLSRKINGYDFGAFNNYQENGSTHSFAFGAASFHHWWFNHIPHNPGVSEGKLNNWWPYIYDCNRFDGSEIQYAVGGFPVAPLTYVTTNEEYGTEETGNDDNWMFWHTNTGLGQRADLSVIGKPQNPDYVKNGQSSIKVEVQVEYYSIDGRNDLSYPRYRNAHWNFSFVDSITISVKFASQQLVRGTNPIIRLCKNGNNRIEFIPKKAGLYTNLFNDNTLMENDGWYTFHIPVSGNDSWERNIIGYIDPELDLSDQAQARQEIIKNILEDVNYFEISIQSDGGRGESLVYYVDNLRVHIKDTTEVPLSILSFSLVNKKTGAEIQMFQDSITLDLANLQAANLSIEANTFPKQVGSVEFIFDSKFTYLQNGFPYRFALPSHLSVGTHTVTANVYSKSHKQGVKGVGKSAIVTVVNSAAVVGFDVVDIFGKLIIPLNEGDKLNIKDRKFELFSIRANTWPQPVGFVKFWVNGRFYRQENSVPYSLNGDANGIYYRWKPRPGQYTLEAVPYTKSGDKVYPGRSLKIHFKIVEEESTIEVVGFDLVDTSGKFLMHLRDGDKINIKESAFKLINIIANTMGPVGSVNFHINNRSYRTENNVPYTLAGDQNGKFNAWSPGVGDYKLTAIPHSESHAKGTVGKSLTINISVVSQNTGSAYRLATNGDLSEENALQEGSGEVLVYPVPVDDQLYIKIDDAVGNDAVVTIVNFQGLSLYKERYSKHQAINTIELKPGIYLLQVVNQNGFRGMVKFIKK